MIILEKKLNLQTIFMKRYFTICLSLVMSFAAAQNFGAESTYSFDFFVKASIHLKNDSIVTGVIIKITDSAVVLSAPSSDSNKSQLYQSILIPAIQQIKLKTGAVGYALAAGAVLGGIAGYGLGYITYDYDYLISDADNTDERKVRGAIGALITAVPGAIIGGIVGIFGSKKSFRINGRKEKMIKLKRALQKLKKKKSW
jgi:hypothetical protein